MPPTTVAMKAIRMTLAPIVGDTDPVWAVSRIAAAPASRPESAKATAITVSARIPRTRAIRKSSAAARICVPIVVRRMNNPSATRRPSVTPTTTTSSFWIETDPISNESPRPVAKPVERGVDPQIRAARFWRRKLRANEVINSVAGLACRTGRNAIRSSASASATETTSTSGITSASSSGISTTANAPAMTSSPWAKLTRRMIPKIRAMPSAKSAYRLPSEIASTAC